MSRRRIVTNVFHGEIVNGNIGNSSSSRRPKVNKGNDMILVGSSQHVEGNRNNVIGSSSVVIGDENIVTGSSTKVTGNRNQVTGPLCRVRGDNNRVNGNNCQVWGEGNIIHGVNNTLNGEPVSFNGGNMVVRENVFGYGRMIFNNMVIGGEEEEASVKRTKRIIMPPASIKDTPATNPEKTCIVCLTNEPTCAALPCGHLNFCVMCSRTLVFGVQHDTKEEATEFENCPKCRGKVTEFKYMHQ